MILCTFAGAIAAANLYYTYPILNKAADEFGITYQRASLIPQLLQGGYGLGIFLICPMGDVFRLRPLILTLTSITTLTWLGLCLTPRFDAFVGLSFLTGFLTVGPQLMLPLVSNLAPPERKTTAVSIVLCGLLLGLAVPRVVAGIVTQYTYWRNVFWAALAMQGMLLVALWLLFPDFPKTVGQKKPGGGAETGTETETETEDGQPDEAYHRKYLRILREIFLMTVRSPVLVWGCTVTFMINAVQASFWTVLTAHLSASATTARDPGLGYGPLQIGIFSIAAIVAAAMIPPYSYFVIERLATFVSSSIGLAFGIACIALDAFTYNYGKGLNIMGVGGPLLQAVGVDFGSQVASVAFRAAVYKALPANRANVSFTGSSFIGQLVGTMVGNGLYAKGGWTRVGIFHLCVIIGTLAVVYFRGPRETGWFGWRGGAAWRLETCVDEKRRDLGTASLAGSGDTVAVRGNEKGGSVIGEK